jgi:hypothetical protein
MLKHKQENKLLFTGRDMAEHDLLRRILEDTGVEFTTGVGPHGPVVFIDYESQNQVKRAIDNWSFAIQGLVFDPV